MSLSKKILTGFGFLLLLISFGIADLYVTKNLLMFPQMNDADLTGETEPSMPQAPLTGTGVAKQSGPNVEDALAKLQIMHQPTDTQSLLRRVVAPPTPVTTLVLLKDGDRVGLLSWVQSPRVKTYFLALKEALHTSFSPEMKDLVDEAQQREGKPVRNFLTFLDTAVDPERLVFIRIRDRLYEFHIAEGKDDVMFGLVEALTN